MSAPRRPVHARKRVRAISDRPRPKTHQRPDVPALTASGRCHNRSGKESVVHFEDTNPTEIVSTPGTVAMPSKSAFQTGLIVIRVRRRRLQRGGRRCAVHLKRRLVPSLHFGRA